MIAAPAVVATLTAQRVIATVAMVTALDVTAHARVARFARAACGAGVLVRLHHAVHALVLTELAEEACVTLAVRRHPDDDRLAVVVHRRVVVRRARALRVTVVATRHRLAAVAVPVVLADARQRAVTVWRAGTAAAAVDAEVAQTAWILARHAAVRSTSAVTGALTCHVVDVALALSATQQVTLRAAVAVLALTCPGVAVLESGYNHNVTQDIIYKKCKLNLK